ncbi:hypothetical protein AMTRI_Chr02g263040 [Amborella trichopoda]
MAELLNMGLLLDILDEEWMMDTLPDDDIPLPTVATFREGDGDDAAPENDAVIEDTWQELALETQ